MENKNSLGMSIAECAVELGIAKPMMYELAGRPDFPKIRVGRRIVVPRQAFANWLIKEAGGDTA